MPRKPFIPKLLSIAVTVIIVVILLWFTVDLVQQRKERSNQLAIAVQERDRFQVLVEHTESQREKLQLIQKDVLQCLRCCQTADEIPFLGGNHLAVQSDGETVVFYVPSGSHELTVRFVWGDDQDVQDWKSNDDGELPETLQQSTETIPLIAESGYRFQVDLDRKSSSVRWTLASNHAEFQPKSCTVFESGYRSSGSSYGGHEQFMVPNQLRRYWNDEDLKLIESPDPSTLLSTTFRGKLDDQPVSMVAKLSLKSDTPVSVPWQLYHRVVQKKIEQLALPYQGDGAIYLKPKP
ncbi:hypothetical protein [Stieleria varia]|uniref:Uncharacterized protein n=1 Tax=Stieleria varia TaxID=2528005 RepID=A0A5C6B4H2_9BACT|nr:hypothetical protein [Stieleria varia]TWU06462.1 hypothetical protein Pla52n_21830 [Stieleria varia]